MLRITAKVRDEMFAHALRGQPLEACGMFSSPAAASLVDEFHPMTNDAESATVFRLDGQQLLDLEAATDAAGRELRGVMHSHVTTSAYPSPTDVADISTFDPNASFQHVIVSLRAADPVMRCYRIVDGQVVEEQIMCESDLPSVDDGSPAAAVAAAIQLRPS